MKQIRKIVAALLAAIMILSAVPVGLTDLDETASAGTLSQYCQTAAAAWGREHWSDYTSLLLGKGYYSDGGDCANFVSQCLYMGGLDMDSLWNTSRYFCYWGDYYGNDYAGSFIRCDQLYRYLKHLGAEEIRNPSASKVDIGDVIIYSKKSASDKTHSAICIDKVNGVPIMAAHTTDGTNAMYTTYDGKRDWHLGFSGNLTFLLKLHGSTCVNNNPRDFDVYIAAKGTPLYYSTNTNGGYSRKVLSGSYIHVYKKSADGKWGYTFNYGDWGWVLLSKFNYQRHITSAAVDHDWGSWYTVKKATCVEKGLDQRVCNRCGKVEQRTTYGSHVVTSEATCTTPAVCSLCGTEVTKALGHSAAKEYVVTKQPTCTEKGEKRLYCSRVCNGVLCNALLDVQEIPALGHDYEATVTNPTCTQNGITTYVCSRCKVSYVDYINKNNTWSGWTTEKKSYPSSKIKTKTQYRYRDYQTTTSYATSMSGWTRGSYTLVKDSSKSGSVRFAPEWHNGFDTSNSLYKTYKKADGSVTAGVPTNFLDYDGQTVVDNDTTKVVIDKDYVVGYIYWHWCRNDHKNTNEHIEWYSGTYDGNSYTTFHAFYKDGTDYDYVDEAYAFKYSNTSVCDSTYWWNGRERTEIGESAKAIYVKQQDYTTYKKNYTYSRWTDWSSWSDTAVTASSTRKVETRTMYSYDIAALGHNFTVGPKKEWNVKDKELELNSDGTLKDPLCYLEGYSCSRCGALDSKSKTNHSIPDWNTEKSSYKLVSSKNGLKVYRGYCKNGCGCYVTRTENDCKFEVSKTVNPTCTEKGYTEYKCVYHNETYIADYVDALGHDTENGTRKVIKEADCENGGEIEIFCIRYDNGKTCSHSVKEATPALGHKLEKTDAVEATCTTDGNSEYYTCTVCGKYFSDEDGKNEIKEDSWVIKALGHNDGEWRTITEAACGTTGWEELHCTREINGEKCDELLDEREIPEITPDYYVYKTEDAELNEDGEYVGTTCEYPGFVYWTCRICENTEHRHGFITSVDALEHIESEEKIEEEATCTSHGHAYTECTRCGIHLSEKDIEELGHDYGTEQTIFATCTTDGYVFHDCKRDTCSETHSDGTVGGHREIIRTLDKTGHALSPLDDGYASSNDKMKLVSSVDNVCGNGKVETYQCTHTDKNTNKPCEYTVTIGTAKDHVLGDYVTAKEATCTETGYKHKECQNDGCTYHTTDEEIPALGHDYKADTKRTKAATCTEDGLVAYTCTRCGKTNDTVIPALGHDCELTGHTDATCTESSTDTYSCKRDGCTYSYTTDNADCPGHDYSGSFEVAKKATCTEDGYYEKHCVRVNNGTLCDAVIGTITIKAREHKLEVVRDKVPTCLDKGNDKESCLNTDETDEYEACTYVKDYDVDPTGHDWGEWFISVNETCTEKGENKRICKNDATHIETTERDALGHDMGEWYTDKAPDYGVEGVSRRDCQREGCDYYETKPIPALEKNKYTATFVVKNDDGTEETVGTVVFEEGTKSISEPEVPEKKNFVGRWNDYELNDEDITIYASYEKINTDPEEIEVKKEAKNDNGKAVITLTASSGSRTVMFNSKSTKALDVILVLDQSGSMADNGKKDKLVNCAKDFVNKLYENGKATGADHRIALVGFACAEIDQAGYYNYQNTKILAANNSTDGYQYKNGGLTDSQYANALMPVVVDGQLNGIIANSITTEKIKAYGATAADLGFEMAKGILSSTDTSADRERIVVFITDGTPTYSSEQSNSDVKKPAKYAIETAKEIKNDLDTDVYSVLIGVKDDEINIGSGHNTEKFSRKTFMNAVSSNYPGAVSMDNIGSDTTDKGYYFNATDTSSFDKIFSNVLYSSVYKTVNFSKVSFFDTLSSDITLTIEDEAKMREDIIAQYGISDNDIIVARNSDGTTYLEFRNIPVKNVFDAEGNLSYCASVTFKASLNENAVSEGTYETNTDNAGVKIGDDTVSKFDVPTVTVTPARNIVVFKINGVTYSITDGEQGDIIEAPVTELGTWNIPEGTTITSSCAVFEAEVSEQKYLVTWFVGDKNITEEYSIGEKITVPESITAPDGMEITGWSPAVNCYCMGENIAYTAILAETHTHKYVQYNITGSCDEGCTVYLRCELCNDEITQQRAPAEHKLKTRVNAYDTNTIESVYCTVCHKSKDMRLVVEKAPSKRQNPLHTVYDFNLTQNSIEIQPGDKMLIKIELTDEQLGKKFNVYRVEEDREPTKVPSYEEDGYLVIEADHFCYYVLSELDENGNELAPVSYDTAMCAFNKHKFTSAVTTAPTCLETGVMTYTCSNCGTFYTEEVEATGHTDRDNDNYCDDCGVEINHIDCSHICHSTNKFMQFIWKILNFFNKIFKMDEKCECGKMHW